MGALLILAVVAAVALYFFGYFFLLFFKLTGVSMIMFGQALRKAWQGFPEAPVLTWVARVIFAMAISGWIFIIYHTLTR